MPPELGQTFDVLVKRKSEEEKYVCAGVPPEEIRIAKDCRTIDDVRYIAHEVMRTASDLISEGWPADRVAQMPGDPSNEGEEERADRHDYDGSWDYDQNEGDASQRKIRVTEAYLRVDYNGDGKAEYRKVVKAGTYVHENEVTDDHPFSLFTPILMPYKVIGLWFYDLVEDLQRIKTALPRQVLDNVYLSNNPNSAFYLERRRNYKPFRFNNMWLLYNGFKGMLLKTWNNAHGGIFEKMQYAKDDILSWNMSTFGNVFAMKHKLIKRLEGIGVSLMSRDNPYLDALQGKLLREYDDILSREELLWKQKSRVDWLKEGDKNTKFFHTSAIIKRRRNYITKLLDADGTWTERQHGLLNIAEKQFTTIFCKQCPIANGSIREKLYALGVWKKDHDEIIADLIEQNYLDEERFAIAFAGGKFRIKHWGRVRIKYELKQKQVSEYCIKKALAQIDDEDYQRTLNKLATDKYESLKADQWMVRKKKTIDYLMHKGYEPNLITGVVNSMKT